MRPVANGGLGERKAECADGGKRGRKREGRGERRERNCFWSGILNTCLLACLLAS